jgi:hypothetical protein
MAVGYIENLFPNPIYRYLHIHRNSGKRLFFCRTVPPNDVTAIITLSNFYSKNCSSPPPPYVVYFIFSPPKITLHWMGGWQNKAVLVFNSALCHADIWGSGGIAPPSFILAVYGGELRPRSLYPRDANYFEGRGRSVFREPRQHLVGETAENHRRLESCNLCFGQDSNLSLPRHRYGYLPLGQPILCLVIDVRLQRNMNYELCKYRT